jgi:hypothetical protein
MCIKTAANTPISKRFVIGSFAYLYPRGHRLKCTSTVRGPMSKPVSKKIGRYLLDDYVVVYVTMTTHCFLSTEL